MSSKKTGDYVDEITGGLRETDYEHISVPAGGGRLLVACELLDRLLADDHGPFRRVLYIAENENMARHAMDKISEYTGIETVEVSKGRYPPWDSEISVISAELLEDDGYKSIPSDRYDFVICEEIDGLAEAARYFETKIFGMTRRSTQELKLDGVEWFDCSPVTVRTRERIISPFSVLALPDEELFEKSFALDKAALKQGVFLATPGTFRDTLLEIRGFCGIYLFAQKVGLSGKDPRVKHVFKSVPVQDLSVSILFCMLRCRVFSQWLMFRNCRHSVRNSMKNYHWMTGRKRTRFQNFLNSPKSFHIWVMITLSFQPLQKVCFPFRMNREDI